MKSMELIFKEHKEVVTVTVSFPTKAEKERVIRHAEKQEGRYGFSRYARKLFAADLASAKAK